MPSVAEAGIAGFDVTSWNALFAPTGTPPEIVAALGGALRDILAEPATAARLLELGIEAQASTPQDLTARLEGDIKKWSEVIEKAGIQRQ